MKRIITLLSLSAILMLAACESAVDETTESVGGESGSSTVAVEESSVGEESGSLAPAPIVVEESAGEQEESAAAAIADQPADVAEEAPGGTVDGAVEREAADITTVDDEGATSIDAAALDEALAVPQSSDLTVDEIAGLQFMREEEKLAYDVYSLLYAQWGLPIFNNIAQSELTHTSAVLTVLERYALSDPAAGNAPGVFTDPTLQALYDDLVAQGGVSAVKALEVGALIEDVDIADLLARSAATENEDILLLYASLQRGSENHLRAFTSQLSNQYGVVYAPQFLDQAAYDAILSAGPARGNSGQGGQGRGRGGPGG
jgi:hypothetical protein